MPPCDRSPSLPFLRQFCRGRRPPRTRSETAAGATATRLALASAERGRPAVALVNANRGDVKRNGKRIFKRRSGRKPGKPRNRAGSSRSRRMMRRAQQQPVPTQLRPPLAKRSRRLRQSSSANFSISTWAGIQAPVEGRSKRFARILPPFVERSLATDLPRSPDCQKVRVRVSIGLLRPKILLCALGLALASTGCSGSSGGGGIGGAGGGATGGAAAAGTGGGAAARGGGGNGGGGLGGAGDEPDGATGGGGARQITDGGAVDGQNACSASNPDPCLCGRPDANPISARECAQEMKCRAAGGVWEPYIVFLPDGGEYGPRCQTRDGSVFDAS